MGEEYITSGGFGGDGRLKLLGLDFVVVVYACGEHDRLSTRHLHNFLVAHPLRCRKDDFISRVDFLTTERRWQEALLGSRRNHNLVHGVFQSVVALELLHDRFPDAGVPGTGV